MPRISETDLEQIKQEILQGARECFVTYGYDGATVSRLEETIGKSRGAIFHHFKNKDALFLAVAHDDMLRMTASAKEHGMIGLIRHILASPERTGWWTMRVEILRRVRNDPHFRAKWELDQRALRAAVHDRLSGRHSAGKLRNDVDPETMYQVLDVVLEGVMAKLSTDVSTEGIPQALDHIEQSLRAPQGATRPGD